MMSFIHFTCEQTRVKTDGALSFLFMSQEGPHDKIPANLYSDPTGQANALPESPYNIIRLYYFKLQV